MIVMALSFSKRLLNDCRGLAAIEFALILPVMLLSLVGAIVVSDAMFANRKVTLMASTLADLVSQDTDLTAAERNIILAAGRGTTSTINPTAIYIRITSIVADDKKKTTVGWSIIDNDDNVGKKGEADPDAFPLNVKGRAITVPDDIIDASGSVILAEVRVLYPPLMGELVGNIQQWVVPTRPGDPTLSSGWLLAHQFYLKPRRSPTIAYTP